jgi:hypothetical protein
MFVGTEALQNGLNKGKITQPYWRREKDSSFLLDYVRWVWAQYNVGMCALNPKGVLYTNSFAENRLYGRGMQPSSKYRDMIDPPDKKGDRYMDIDWETEKILPNLRTAIKEMIHEINLDPHIEAVDDRSTRTKEFMVAKMKMATDPKIQQLMTGAGMDPSEILPAGVETEDDVEFYSRMEAIKLIEEIEIKDLVDKTMSQGGWDVIKDMCADDIVDNHTVVCHLRKVGNRLVMEYVDPAKVVTRKSKYPDYRDADYMGFWQSLTLSELREMGVEENELTDIAKKYAGIHNNAQSSNWDLNYRDNYLRQNSNLWYDGYTIDVFTCYFMCRDAEKYMVGRHHKMGNEIYDKVSNDAKLDERDERRGKRIKEEVATKLYKVNWVIGTNCIFMSGENTDNVLDENNTPVIPIIMVTGDGPSPVEKAIPLVDDIHLAIYKIRHALKKMAPGPRMRVDMSKLLSSLTFGDDKISMKEIIQNYPRTGLLFYHSVGDYADPSMPSQSDPFSFMESGIAEDLTILGNELAMKTDRLRTVMGVNALMDGSSRQPNMLKGVMEGLVMSGNTVNRPYSRLMMIFYRRIITFIGNYWRNAIVYGEESGYPKDVLDRLNKSNFRYDVRFGLSEDDKQILIQDLIIKRDSGLIEPDAFIVVYNMIKRGDFAKAALYFSKIVKEGNKRRQAEQMQLVQAQTQGNQEAGMAIEQAKAKANEDKHDMELETIGVQTDEDIRKFHATKQPNQNK